MLFLAKLRESQDYEYGLCKKKKKKVDWCEMYEGGMKLFKTSKEAKYKTFMTLGKPLLPAAFLSQEKR